MIAAAPHSGPDLVNIPSNPVPEGARVGYFVTEDKVRLRYALWPRLGAVKLGPGLRRDDGRWVGELRWGAPG
jgi:lysophospholipase